MAGSFFRSPAIKYRMFLSVNTLLMLVVLIQNYPI